MEEESNQEQTRTDDENKRSLLMELIPREIMELMIDGFSITDQFQFSRVCKSCHSLALKRPIPRARENPWLLALTHEFSSCRRNICNSNNKNKKLTCYQIQATTSFKHSNPYIIGCFKGWLFLQYRNHDLIQLINIFSNICLDLPPLPGPAMPNFVHSEKVPPPPSPSPPPLPLPLPLPPMALQRSGMKSDKSPDLNNKNIQHAKAFAVSFCKFMRPTMVAVVSSKEKLALCKIGGKAWEAYNYHQDEEEKYVNVTFHNTRLYAIRKGFDKVDIFGTDDDDLKLNLVGIIDSSQAINIDSLMKKSTECQAYLVGEPKGNDLFLVMKYIHLLRFPTIKFEIFKVEEDEGGRQIVEIMADDMLEDQIVLLSDTCCEIVDVKDCYPNDDDGNHFCCFQGNQICFTCSNDLCGIYCLKDETVNWVRPCHGMYCLHWIFPTFGAQCDCESHLAPSY